MVISEQRSVSVVITCYNQARFIGEAIESVLTQEYHPVEIIVVDDGSIDNTSDVVARYPGVRYIRQANQGVAGARNTGLRESKGSYVVFLDGDDRLTTGALETGASALDEHPDCAFVFGRCNLITADGSPLPTKHDPYIEHDHYLKLLRSNYIWMPAKVMFRRGVLESVGGFDVSADHAGDYHMYLHVTRNLPVYDHGKVVAEWRQHSANTSRNSVLMLKSALKVLRSQRPYVKGDKRYREAYQAGIRYWEEFYGDPLVEAVRSQVWAHGQRKQGLRNAAQLLRYSPRMFAKHAGRKLYRVVFRIRG